MGLKNPLTLCITRKSLGHDFVISNNSQPTELSIIYSHPQSVHVSTESESIKKKHFKVSKCLYVYKKKPYTYGCTIIWLCIYATLTQLNSELVLRRRVKTFTFSVFMTKIRCRWPLKFCTWYLHTLIRYIFQTKKKNRIKKLII